MKRQSIFLLFLLLGISFMISGKIASAAKKLEKKESRPLYVQQGKSYKLSKILSDIKDPDEDDTLKNCLKGKKVTWSAKKSQIKLTEKTITVKKQGEFKLTGATKNYKYVITLVSGPEKWPEIPEGITRVSIMKEGRTVEVKDVNTVNYLRNLFNSGDYRFNYDRTNWQTSGWEYAICFYAADGTLERKFSTAGPYVMGKYWYKRKNPLDIYQRVSEIYNRVMTEQGAFTGAW